VPSLVQSVEGVDFSYGVRAVLQDYGLRDIMIFAIDMDGYARTDLFQPSFTGERPITFIPTYDR